MNTICPYTYPLQGERTATFVKQLGTPVDCLNSKLFPCEIYWSTTRRRKRKEHILERNRGEQRERERERERGYMEKNEREDEWENLKSRSGCQRMPCLKIEM